MSTRTRAKSIKLPPKPKGPGSDHVRPFHYLEPRDVAAIAAQHFASTLEWPDVATVVWRITRFNYPNETANTLNEVVDRTAKWLRANSIPNMPLDSRQQSDYLVDSDGTNERVIAINGTHDVSYTRWNLRAQADTLRDIIKAIDGTNKETIKCALHHVADTMHKAVHIKHTLPGTHKKIEQYGVGENAIFWFRECGPAHEDRRIDRKEALQYLGVRLAP